MYNVECGEPINIGCMIYFLGNIGNDIFEIVLNGNS